MQSTILLPHSLSFCPVINSERCYWVKIWHVRVLTNVHQIGVMARCIIHALASVFR